MSAPLLVLAPFGDRVAGGGGGKWSAFVLAVAVAWTPVPTPALGKLFRDGVLVKAHARLPGKTAA
jgi:hypothetical protein